MTAKKTLTLLPNNVKIFILQKIDNGYTCVENFIFINTKFNSYE
jgi:hypothetical protein